MAGIRQVQSPGRVRAETRPRVSPAPPDSDPEPLPGHAVLLLVALAAAVVGQGAYYSDGKRLLALLLGVAAVLAIRLRPWSSKATWAGPRRLAVALAGWAVISAALAGDPISALPVAALLAGVMAVLVVCSRLTPVQRDALVSGVVVLGALVAVSGWAGVAWRATPLALEDGGLWRAASPLTYANATAGFLVPVALLALARLVRRGREPLEAVVVCVLLMGVGATLSRVGLLSLVVGGIVLAVLSGPRRVARAVAAPAVGAAVALLGLSSSMPGHLPGRPAVAVVALGAGLVAAGLLSALGSRALAWAVGGVAALAFVAVSAGFPRSADLSAIGRPRLTLSSPDRVDAGAAALGLVADRPLAGSGPGGATLAWTGPNGDTLIAQYAHNEYLQVLVELGAVGLVLVIALMAAVAVMVSRGRRAAPSPELWAGAAAGLVALALHSGFDFLWHIPVIPILGALLAGVTLPTSAKEQP